MCHLIMVSQYICLFIHSLKTHLLSTNCVLDTVWTLAAMWRVVWARERMDQAEGHKDQAESCWVITEAQGELQGTA